MIHNNQIRTLTLVHRTWRQCNSKSSHLSRSYSHEAVQRPVQIYTSSSHDPYLNLSIEHHLLQESPPDSAVLFLYINKPSIIIGRNQNPWLEVNLPLLQNFIFDDEPVNLVRRRSGGGTVFHDHGNVNWSMIVPPTGFTRDKHAEVVVKALRSCGVERARVNERHDVVLDQGSLGAEVPVTDLHRTRYQQSNGIRPLKVSGSAYKLTKHRALHHGTTLLSSPNLGNIHQLLRSPAKPFITAKGVESVSSPVGNVGISKKVFMDAVRKEFGLMYSPSRYVEPQEVGHSWLQLQNVQKGVGELKSLHWTYLQTPQFTVETRPDTSDFEGSLPEMTLNVRYGEITEHNTTFKRGPLTNSRAAASLVGRKLHEIDDWPSALQADKVGSDERKLVEVLAAWLSNLFPGAGSPQSERR